MAASHPHHGLAGLLVLVLCAGVRAYPALFVARYVSLDTEGWLSPPLQLLDAARPLCARRCKPKTLRATCSPPPPRAGEILHRPPRHRPHGRARQRPHGSHKGRVSAGGLGGRSGQLPCPARAQTNSPAAARTRRPRPAPDSNQPPRAGRAPNKTQTLATGRRPAPRSTTIAALLGGKAVAKLCPGTDHAVRVSFPLPRFGLLTASAGEFAEGDPWDCPGRVALDKARQEGFDVTLKVPCSGERERGVGGGGGGPGRGGGGDGARPGPTDRGAGGRRAAAAAAEVAACGTRGT